MPPSSSPIRRRSRPAHPGRALQLRPAFPAGCLTARASAVAGAGPRAARTDHGDPTAAWGAGRGPW